MQLKLYLKRALIFLVFFLMWLGSLYMGRFSFFYNDNYVVPSYLYYEESTKDFNELREYIDSFTIKPNSKSDPEP